MTFYKSPMMVAMLSLFLILVGATGYRIITALETHPGLVVEDAYLSGESYANTLDYKNQLKTQGWTLELTTPELPIHGTLQIYQASSAQYGKALTGAKVMAYFYRPLEPKYDFSSLMKFDNDTYQAKIKLPLKGRWDFVVEVTKGEFLQRASTKMFIQ
ncbi:FixH family protein [Candidatus Thioglobus sp.]|jgi:FixH.|uniref:FixH family protein n=1 Tax=Candidatus Thioglobus sp. TaxID=2026721 RepID=UPI00324296C1